MPRKKMQMPSTPAKDLSQEPEEEQSAEEEGPQHSTLQPPTLFFPQIRPNSVDLNGSVRTVGKILQNGTRFAAHPSVNFNQHYNLMIQLQNAFDQRLAHPEEAEQQFLATLEQYLREARGHIPQALVSDEQIERVIQEIRALIGNLSAQGNLQAFHHVASYLLQLAHSGFDRF